MLGRLLNVLLLGVAACCLWVASGEAVDYELARQDGTLTERAASGTLSVAPGAATTPTLGGAAGEGNEPASGAENLSGRAASIRAIRSVFPGNARALAVARCESRFNARAVSSTGDYGVFQLNRRTWDPARNPHARPYWPKGKDWRHVFDPVVNARVAYAISKRGTDFWTHWKWSSGCWA